MNTTTTSPWRTRDAAVCIAMFVAYVLAMATAFKLGGPAGWVAWAVALAALTAAILFARRSTKAVEGGDSA